MKRVRWLIPVVYWVTASCVPAGVGPARSGDWVDSAADEGAQHNVYGCNVYDMHRRMLRSFRGGMCAFLPDGRYVADVEEGEEKGAMAMYAADGSVRWRREYKLNHQLNLTRAGTRLLTLATETFRIRKRRLRGDVALALDLDGNTLGRFSFHDHMAEIEKWVYPAGTRPAPFPDLTSAEQIVATEISHANTISEIPENPYGAINSAFRAGNVLLNSVSMEPVGLRATFVLDREMKHVLWGAPLERFGTVQTHDVQVLPNGHLLYFQNEGMSEAGFGARQSGCCSGLVEFDLERDRVVWSWAADPPSSFFSIGLSGVQLLPNGNLLFNNGILGFAREISRAGRPIWDLVRFEYAVPWPSQQIKRLDLREFLARNRDVSALPTAAQANRAMAATRVDPSLFYGYFSKEGLPVHPGNLGPIVIDRGERHPSALAGLSVAIDGALAPVFIAENRVFAVELPSGWDLARLRRSCVEVRVGDAARGARVTTPVEAYPGMFTAGFARLSSGRAACPPERASE